MREEVIKSESDTERFGLAIADGLRAGDVLALVGDLGTGKTTLTGYIARGLGITEMITSPTFTVVKEYYSGRLPLYHFDVYRIEDADDAFERGIEEYFYRGGVCVVEWAEKIEELLPGNTKVIFMEHGKAGEERIFRCTF